MNWICLKFEPFYNTGYFISDDAADSNNFDSIDAELHKEDSNNFDSIDKELGKKSPSPETEKGETDAAEKETADKDAEAVSEDKKEDESGNPDEEDLEKMEAFSLPVLPKPVKNTKGKVIFNINVD